MSGRNDQAIANALQALAQAIRNQKQQQANVGLVEYNGLDRFQQNNPPSFCGGYNPDDAHKWLREIEKIFSLIACPEGQKVAYATYMMTEEAKYWWDNTHQYLEVAGHVGWDAFKAVFLEKYFPENVKNKKEMEFLELKQGNMTVVEYAAKFEELVRYSPPYQGPDNEGSKCVKFIYGLRPEVKLAVNYLGSRKFPRLVNMCRVFEDDAREEAAYYKNVGSMRNKKPRNSTRYQPYEPSPRQLGAPSGGFNYPFQKAIGKSGGSGGNPCSLTSTSRCFRCGQQGHIALGCSNNNNNKFVVTCYGCGQKGHIQKWCPSMKEHSGGDLNASTSTPRTMGRVFALNTTEACSSLELIQGE